MKSPSKLPFFSTISYASVAILGAIFALGIMVGISFSSVASSGPENIASREVIDASAPNPELCLQYGSSAITMDARLFVTLNPFKVYVSRAETHPGCVLRNSNWSILEQKNLITSEQVQDCKHRMNTFGFTGDLNQSPEVSCVYENNAAQNFFVNQPQMGAS